MMVCLQFPLWTDEDLTGLLLLAKPSEHVDVRVYATEDEWDDVDNSPLTLCVDVKTGEQFAVSTARILWDRMCQSGYPGARDAMAWSGGEWKLATEFFAG